MDRDVNGWNADGWNADGSFRLTSFGCYGEKRNFAEKDINRRF